MRRYWRAALAAAVGRGRMLVALTVFGVALGIASVLGIQIINRGALAAFRGAVQAVSGDADLTIVPRTAMLPDSVYAAALATPGVAAAWPVYQVSAALVGRHRYYLDVVGVDVFAPSAAAWSPDTGQAPFDPATALAVSGWSVVSPPLARELGLAVGSPFDVSSGTRRARLVVGAIVDFQRVTPLASRKLVVMDLAQAQHLLGTRGGLTQVDVRLAPGATGAAVAARLARMAGPAADVLTPEQRARRADGLTRAFRLNISALSLISLVVGFFLVHTATQAALVRRRTEFGILRATGATRAQVLALVLADTGLLGLLGVALGLPLGWLLARANLGAVSSTLANLYLLNEIERLELPWGLAVLAAALGLAAAFAGALGPALDLARADVRDLLAPMTLHEHARGRAGGMAAAGLALPALALAWYATVARAWEPAGFVLAIALLLALPLVVPWLLRGVAARIRLSGFGLGYSIRSLVARLQTTAFAIASLAIAVAMLVGITVMIGSFRRTVTTWIGTTLQADVFVTTPSWRGAGGEGTLDDSVAAALTALPGVRAADRLRGFQGWTRERRIGIAGVDMALAGGEARFPLQSGESREAFALVRERGEVIITEPLARKAGLAIGDSLPLTTPAGERNFRIAAVSYDYASENGGVAMDLGTYAAVYGPGPLNSLALYAAPGVDPEVLADLARARFDGLPLQVRSNRSLRREVLAIFDQTFAVTRLLQVMALLVAATGITLTLLILAREREAELALYRALGATRGQIFRFFVGKGLGIGAGGIALGSLAGFLLALILVFVINRAYFGWTIQLAAPWGQLASGMATIVAAAVAASLYPAWRAGRASATQLARDDL